MHDCSCLNLYSWSSLVHGDEGLQMPNSQSNFVIVVHELSLLFGYFINATA